MPVFNLSENTMALLRAKFREFRRERERLHGLLADYAADYRQFQGTARERGEYLEGRYARRAVVLSHLLWDEAERAVYWHREDIRRLLGRDPSTLSRTLSAMERSEGWCSRLLALRKEARSANGNVIHVYRQEIFDLILDHYEEEYLLRFAEPRRGDPAKAPDIGELRRFWDYLRAGGDLELEGIAAQEGAELPNLPPMGWRDVLTLIWGKVFTLKTGTLASLALALGLWLARRCPGSSPWIPAASVLVLGLCAGLLRLRRGSVGPVSDLGAAAMLFTLLWGAGLLSPEGPPGGPRQERRLDLAPRLMRGGRVALQVTSDFYDDIGEVWYRVSPDAEFRSTGFNDLHHPNLLIEPPQTEGPIALDVRCVDAGGRPLGPWSFAFDLDKERFALSKRFILSEGGPWLSLHRVAGRARAEVSVGSRYADDVVEAIVYGVNGPPEALLRLPRGARNLVILNERDEDVHYVTSYLIFDDGASSDVRWAR